MLKSLKCTILCVAAGAPEVTYIAAVQANLVSMFIPTFMWFLTGVIWGEGEGAQVPLEYFFCLRIVFFSFATEYKGNKYKKRGVTVGEGLYRVRQKNLIIFKSRYIGNRVRWGNATKASG